MTVPEATMYKNNSLPLGKDDVRPSGKIAIVQSEAKARCMKHLADEEFGTSVLAPNTAHHATSGDSVNDVDHLGVQAKSDG